MVYSNEKIQLKTFFLSRFYNNSIALANNSFPKATQEIDSKFKYIKIISLLNEIA
jgi:hypothetical protein